MSCVDCGSDLTALQDAHHHPYLCAVCARAREVARERRRDRKTEANRRYQRLWARGRRRCKIRFVVCEACALLFTAHGPARRKLCDSCQAFYYPYAQPRRRMAA